MARSSLGQSAGGKAYLFVYNVLQFVGWSYGFILFVKQGSKTGKWTGEETWKSVSCCLTFFQTLQAIEVVHCAVGLVPSNTLQTGMQIFSRLLVVWGVLRPVVETRDNTGLPLIMIAWSFAEATRYIYYALNLYDLVPHFLTWCRYTFFIILYPMGLTGELLLIYASLAPIAKTGLYSLPMPNPINVSFSYYYALIVMMLSYIPFFPQLYLYMLGQRKKFLGPDAGKSVEAAKKSK